MPVLDGFLTRVPEPGFANANLSLGLHDLLYLDFPPRDSIGDTSCRTAFVYADALPVAVDMAHAQDGLIPRSYYDDFYNRIHALPTDLDLGNVVSTQVNIVDIWNAYTTSSVTCEGITGSAPGVSIAGPSVFPMTFTGGQMSTWEISVTTAGPAIISVLYTWGFAEALVNDAGISIIGRRVIAWTVSPDWKNGITEKVQFLTDILTSDSGAEQRRALRVSPRREFRARSLLDRRDRALVDNMVHGWGGQIWAVPMWHDIQLLAADLPAGSLTIPCTTTFRDFEDGRLVILRGPSAFTYETVEVQSFTAGLITLERATLLDWPKGTRIYPARTARLVGQPRFKRLTDQAWDVEYRFALVEPCDWPEATFATTYRSHPVYDVKPDETEELDGTWERMLSVLDNGVAAPHVVDTAGEGFAAQEHRWVMHGAAEHDTVRRLIYALRGRQKSVWVPTHADDIRIAATVADSATTVTIENVGYSLQGLDRVGRRDIRIVMNNGTVFYRRIVDASPISDDTESIVLDTALGTTFAPSAFRRISFLRLMRGDDDDVTIKHDTDITGVGSVGLTFRAIRDDI